MKKGQHCVLSFWIPSFNGAKRVAEYFNYEKFYISKPKNNYATTAVTISQYKLLTTQFLARQFYIIVF